MRDLDGDGRDDLLLVGPTGQVGGLLMDGTTIVEQGKIDTMATGATVIQTR